MHWAWMRKVLEYTVSDGIAFWSYAAITNAAQVRRNAIILSGWIDSLVGISPTRSTFGR